MPTLAKAEERRRFEIANSVPRPFTDSEGRTLQGCHAPNCSAMPTKPGGSLRLVAAKKWFCDRHKHLAAEGDLDPPPPKDVLGPNFNPIPIGEERERLNREEAKRLEPQAEKARQRRAEAEALSKVQDLYEAQTVVSMGGVRLRSDGRIVQ